MGVGARCGPGGQRVVGIALFVLVWPFASVRHCGEGAYRGNDGC